MTDDGRAGRRPAGRDRRGRPDPAWTRARAEWIELGIEHRIPIGPAYDRVSFDHDHIATVQPSAPDQP